MPISNIEQVINTEDIPDSSAENPPLTGTPAATVQEMYVQNRFTRFEMLTFAVTQGYLASNKYFKSDQEFAKSAITLARAIAYQMDKYEGTG